MKKKTHLKMSLHRETLRNLESAQLQEAAGGLSVNGSCCNSSCDTVTLVTCPTRRGCTTTDC